MNGNTRLWFFYEICNWWDIKRTGKPKGLIIETSGRTFTDVKLIFPLPVVEIETNPAVSPGDQNPG